uniref:Uncharacterized protein n=1 Tax=Rhizophora mucronata TaxID=61149 RepID=A0A2P2LCL2_RHIMU
MLECNHLECNLIYILRQLERQTIMKYNITCEFDQILRSYSKITT